MKAESNIKPNALSIEKCAGNIAEIVFREKPRGLRGQKQRKRRRRFINRRLKKRLPHLPRKTRACAKKTTLSGPRLKKLLLLYLGVLNNG